jgi:hypothetical protein
MNSQSWTMDKYITWKKFSSFAGALHAGGAVCTGAHWDKIGDPHRGFSDGVATERGEEAASASATASRWRRRHRSRRSWGTTSRWWRRDGGDARRLHRGEVQDHGGGNVTRPGVGSLSVTTAAATTAWSSLGLRQQRRTRHGRERRTWQSSGARPGDFDEADAASRRQLTLGPASVWSSRR